MTSKETYAYFFDSNNFQDVYSHIADAEEEYINGYPCVIYDNDNKYFDENDILWDAINEYVSQNTRSKNEKIVKNYGFFEAINLQKDNYGMDELHTDDEFRFYAQLAFNIIREDFNIIPLTLEEYKEQKKESDFQSAEYELNQFERENPNASIQEKEEVIRSFLKDKYYEKDDIEDCIGQFISDE